MLLLSLLIGLLIGAWLMDKFHNYMWYRYWRDERDMEPAPYVEDLIPKP